MDSSISFSAHRAVRHLPRNFVHSDRALFAHEFEKEIPATKLLELSGLRISSEGLLFRDRELMLESFAFPENFKQWKRRAIVKAYLNAFLIARKRTLTRAIVWATDDWSGGYFHWLCDVLPRLYTVHDLLEETTLLLPYQFVSLGFVRDSLEMFGVRNVEFIGKNKVVLCPKVYFPTHTARSGDFNVPIIKAVRQRLLDAASRGDRSRPERIYISRGGALKRRIANEDAVRKVITDFGFHTINAEDHSFREQVEAFSSARYIVSNHGAGLTNMLFANEEARVLELRHRSDAINNCYFNMASALELGYFYQLCDSADSDDPHTADLLIDTDELSRNLDLMLTR